MSVWFKLNDRVSCMWVRFNRSNTWCCRAHRMFFHYNRVSRGVMTCSELIYLCITVLWYIAHRGMWHSVCCCV